MDGTFDFANANWGRILNSNNAKYTNSLNLCKTLRKYLFRHAKGKSMVNFYTVNPLGQNLANSNLLGVLSIYIVVLGLVKRPFSKVTHGRLEDK